MFIIFFETNQILEYKYYIYFLIGVAVINELSGGDDDLSMFKGQVDMTSPVAAGHSFGGATTLLALQKDKRYKLSFLFSL